MVQNRITVTRRTKSWIRRLRWIAAAMILVAVGIQFGLQPYLGSLGARKIAKELQARYGLVVRYGDPAEFFVPPLERIDTKGSHIRIEAAQKRHVAVALKGVALALKKYPPDLIHRYLSAVFVARTLEIDGVTGAAMFANQWIYVATPARDGQAVQSFELSLHHELSSLFFYGGDFPTLRWHLVNDAQFRYLEDHANIIKAAAPANRQDPRKAREWYAAGFVSDYGMSSMENDVNTYAELAMGDPQKLRQLCDQYPRIAEKKKIFVGFYTRLAPELGAYFESEHLADGPSVQLPSALKKSPQEIRQELTAKNIK